MKVSLRPWLSSDMEPLITQANNSRIAKTMRDRFPHPYTEQDARDWLAINVGVEPVINFVVMAGDEFAGAAGVIPKQDVYRRSMEIGYWLGESFWGQGIATQVVDLLVKHAFQNYDVVRLTAEVFSNNPASMKVVEKNGFFLEGIQQKAVFKQGEFLDTFLWVKLR